MGYQYFKSYGLPIVRTRAFNHEGPRRGDVFVTSNFAKQVAEIEAGLREPVISVGDLKPRRDFSDVRDIVRGLLAAARARRARRGLQPLLGPVVVDPAGARLPARRVPGEGHRRRDRPRAPAALRRDGPRGRPVEDRAGHGVEGGDPVRADPRASSSTTGGRPRVRPARRADAGGSGTRHASGPGPRLAHRDAGRRALPRGVLRALPRGRPLHAAPRAGLGLPGRSSGAASSPRSSSGCPARRAGTARTCRCFPPPSAASTSPATTSCCPRATRWPRACACRRARCTCATASPRCATCGTSMTTTSARARAALTRAAMPPVAAALRRWDRRTAAGVHHFVAISRFIADRIRRCYGRAADVIYPPVDVARFRDRRVARRLLPGGLGPRAVQARRPRGGGGEPAAAAGSSSWARARRRRRLRALAGPHRRVPRLAGRRRGRRAVRALPGARLPPGGGFRHHAARGHGRRAARASRSGRAARSETVVPPGGAEPPTGLFFARRRWTTLVDAMERFEAGTRPLRAEGPPPPRRGLRPAASSRSASSGYLARPARGRRAVLKAHSRAPRAHHAGGRPPGRRPRAGCSPTWCGSTCSARRSGPRIPPLGSLPADAAAHPRRVGRLLPRLRPVPAAAHRLAPVRGGRRREGLLAGRPRPRGGHDVLRSASTSTRAWSSCTSGSCPSPPSASPAMCSARRSAFARRRGYNLRYARGGGRRRARRAR